MYRIKQVRNSTVAKQSQLSPSLAPAKVVKLPPVAQDKIRGPPNQFNGVRLKPPPANQRRAVVVKQQETEERVNRPVSRQKVKINLKHANLTRKKQVVVQSKLASVPEVVEQKKIQMITTIQEENVMDRHQEVLLISKSKDAAQVNLSQVEQNEPSIVKSQVKRQQTLKTQKQKQRDISIASQDQRIANQQQQLEEKQKRKTQQQQEQKRKREEEDQLRHREAEQMMERIQARRKVRQAEKERKRKYEEEVNKQEEILQRQGAGGLISLTDGLAHIEMSEATMDAQVRLILKMKFANYPNKEAIERQVEELDRVNQSYQMVREDPNNPLIGGLANFRTELFNRVGKLVMEGQSQLGPSNGGLQVISSDSRNFPQVPGMRITRGLTRKLDSFISTVSPSQDEECPICLEPIPAGSEAARVRCNHQFHRNCLVSWLENTANCPACRYNIKFDHY